MTDNIADEDIVWTEQDIYDLKRCGKNINTNKNQHYGSEGFYGSFGMKANYMIISQSSLSLYAVAKSKNENRHQSNIEKSNILENKVATEMKQSIASFRKYVRNISHLLSSIVDEAFFPKVIGVILVL